MDEKRQESPTIKVVDRRKFSADGDPVETTAPTAETTAPASPPEDPISESAPPAPESGPATPAPEHRGQSSQQFLELVTLLAGQAELLLVGAEDLPAQPAEAHRMIDYLGILEEKTAGNLSADESKLLSSLLYQLRTFYMQRK